MGKRKYKRQHQKHINKPKICYYNTFNGDIFTSGDNRKVVAENGGNNTYYVYIVFKLRRLIFMLSFEEISKNKLIGEYIAIGSSGKKYNATFIDKYCDSGVMFFCIPEKENIIGYEPAI